MKSPTTISKQRGAILVIALVFLLLMSLVGVSALQNTTQQERMAGNVRDRSLALEAAEAALRAGEADIQANASAVSSSTPLPSPAEWDGVDPPPTGSFSIKDMSGTLSDPKYAASLEADPVYYIEEPRCQRLGLDASEVRWLQFYPVISRGTGGTEHAVVVLRSYFNPGSETPTCP